MSIPALLKAQKLVTAYALRSLWRRKATTLLTTAGVALSVFVLCAVQMLNTGIRESTGATGEPDNALILSAGSISEVPSIIDRAQASVLVASEFIQHDDSGRALLSQDAVALISLDAPDGDVSDNVIVRGVGEAGMRLHASVRIVQGRAFRRGTSEIIVGRQVAARYSRSPIGERLRFGRRDWIVVGTFEAARGGFENEIWADGTQLMQAFRRVAGSTVVARLREAVDFESFKQSVEANPRLTLQVTREQEFYASQAAGLSTFVRVLGLVMCSIFAIAAIIVATITMYSSVATRIKEIGTIRALGFSHNAVLTSFLAESMTVAAIGSAAGVLLASSMQLVSLSIVSLQSFAQSSYDFRLNLQTAVVALALGLVIGLAGGAWPASRAARVNIIEELRTA